MIDGETDADVVGQVLAANPQVLMELLAEPLCAFSAPALVAKLAARGTSSGLQLHCKNPSAGLDWPAVAQLLVSRVAQTQDEKSALARRMYARALSAVLAHADGDALLRIKCRAQAEILGLVEACSGVADPATRQCLQEASFQCMRA